VDRGKGAVKKAEKESATGRSKPKTGKNGFPVIIKNDPSDLLGEVVASRTPLGRTGGKEGGGGGGVDTSTPLLLESNQKRNKDPVL